MNPRLIEYLENSFLGDYLKKENITDISYNGKNFFYMDNILGRKKLPLDIPHSEVLDFVRQIANLGEKQFSYSEPILDFSVSKYRINAVHTSISRYLDDKVVSFCIRIASSKNRIDKTFATKEMFEYIFDLIKNEESIIIAGATGSGKTELQKYLLSRFEDNTRIIVIDNVQELECLREYDNLDLTSWQVSNQNSFELLIRNALRSNPDWLIISESRGKEMSDILLSVMSGHPIITTIHAYNVEEIPSRITRLVLKSSDNQKYEDVYKDVVAHFKNYIYLKRHIMKNGKVVRYISSIGRYDEKTKKVIKKFERKKYEEN